MASLEKAKTLEEKRAALIIQYRKFNVDSVEKEEEKLVYRLSKGDDKYLMHVLLNQKTIGIAFIRDLRDQIEAEEVMGGIIVSDGKYTYSARSNAPEMSIELIPSSLPTFDVFEHAYVPLHEVVSAEERKEMLTLFELEFAESSPVPSAETGEGPRPGQRRLSCFRAVERGLGIDRERELLIAVGRVAQPDEPGGGLADVETVIAAPFHDKPGERGAAVGCRILEGTGEVIACRGAMDGILRLD